MAITKLNNKAVANITTLPVALGDMVLVSSATASSSASIEFTLGNYKEYKFFFVNMHPQTDNVTFQMNFSTDNGSNYNVTKTTTYWRAYHDESDTGANIDYQTAQDLAQSTSYQPIAQQCGNDNDQNTSGMLHLFNPSSTTYVKHFLAKSNHTTENNYNLNIFVAGYANTTSALTNIKFQMSSGNIDDGKILMFGIN
jgi:hypothetical protein